MTDFSNLSNDELTALYSGGGDGTPAGTASPLSQMSDADLQAAYQQAAPPTGPTPSGAYNALDVGIARAVAGTAGLPRTIADLGAAGIQSAANYVGGKLGVAPDTRDLTQPGLLGQLPTSQEAMQAIQQNYYGGAQPYEPQGWGERGLATVGELAPNAMFPGGIASRVASVLAPAAAVSGVREMGGGETAQLAAGLLGAGAASKIGNVAERAAAGLPTFEKMAEVADQQYSTIRNMLSAQNIPSTSISNIVDSIKNALHTQGLRPGVAGNAQKTYEILDDLGAGTGRPPDAVDLLLARRSLAKIRGGEDATAAQAAKDAITQVMDMYVPGSAARLQVADANYNAYRTAQGLDKAYQTAEIKSQKTGNLGDKLREAAASILTNPNRSRFLSEGDKAALNALNQGTWLQSGMRWGGGLLGGGRGLGGAVGAGLLGEYFGGHEGGGGAAIGGLLAGAALRRGYNRSVANAAQQLAQQVLARSPQAVATGGQYVPRMGLLGAGGAAIPTGGILGLANQQSQLPGTPWPPQ